MRLQKNLSNQLDQSFRRQNVDNYTKIEHEHNRVIENNNFHKSEEKNAHRSNQIAHENTTVENMLVYQMERIKNLVQGVDGDGVKEVTDSRVSTDNETHNLLSERLKHDFDKTNKEIDEVKKRFVEINFDIYNPDKTGTVGVNEKLQHALDEIGRAEAGTLIIKNGEYLINKRVSVSGNTTIKMDEHAVLLRGSTGVLFDYGRNNELYAGYDGPGNIHIIGGTLDNNLEQLNKYPVESANMINIRHADNISFTNVKFKNNITYHVLDINGVNNLRIIDCVFEGHKNLLPGSAKEKEAIQISEIMKGGVGGPGKWDGTPCENIVISGCTFKSSKLAGSFDVAIGNHASIHNIYQRNIKITNNTFEGCNIGIKPFKWSNVEVSGNTFTNNNECIRVESVKGNMNSANNVESVPSKQSQAGDIYTIKDNLFNNYNKIGVGIYGAEHNNSIGYVGNVRINDNTFYCSNNDKGENIVVDLCRHVHIRGNNMSYSYRGMNLSASHNVFVDNNYISNVKREGIFINQSKHSGYAMKTNHLNITNNIINTTGRNGMYVQNASFVYLMHNKILNTNQETSDDTNRGGLYVYDCNNGRIEGNDFWGNSNSFAIYGTVLVNFIAFNNGGSGTVRLFGNSAYVGYYNVSSANNIFKKETKGEA